MNKPRLIFRIIFFLLALFLLVYVNKKTDDNTMSIVEFKLKTLQKISNDTLDSKQRLETVLNDTTNFIDHSSHVRKGIHYLIGLLVLWGAVEMIFIIQQRRNYGQQ